MIYGSKDIFGFQLDSISGNLCQFCFWVHGNQFGTIEDTCYIPSFSNQLKGFRSPPPLDLTSEREIKAYLSGKTFDSRYLRQLDPTFDDFEKRCCQNGGYVYLYWKLAKGHSFVYSGTAKKGFFKIPLDVWQDVIDHAIAQLSNARS